MQNTHLDHSLKFAEEIDLEFSTKANRKSRGVKQAPFYVISRTNMPSVLIECGFLTNPAEEDFLQTDSGQEYIASAIFRAFRSYKMDVENIDELVTEEILANVVKKDDNTSKEPTKIADNDIVYKVQIGTFLRSMKNEKSFIELEVKEVFINGTFKYYVGNEDKKSNADLIRTKMLNIGFNGAFIVAFHKDIRISIKEALDLQSKTNGNE
jgi:N-acetylmuramoyl-L-alanine amidase